jgi:hypothetical protein
MSLFSNKSNPEAELKQLGFKTKGFPNHVRRTGLDIIERALNGATATELRGHRLNQNRNAVVVHVHRDYVIVFFDTPSGLKPTHFVSHERYNNMFR